MEYKEIFKSAILALKANKMRSALTMLGIIIGITSVILIASIGQGAVAFVSNELTSFGTNYFSVNPGNNMMSAMTGGEAPLTKTDADVINNANIPNIESVGYFSFANKIISTKDEQMHVNVYGMTPLAQNMLKPVILYGDLLSDADLTSRVVVLGNEVAEKLFGKDTNPVGESVKIGDLRFLVIGVSKSGGTLFGSFFNTAIYIPLDTLQNEISGNKNLMEIDISVKNTNIINDTIDEVDQILRDHRNIKAGEDKDFLIQSFTAQMDTFKTITTLLTVFITGISAISLIVGGVGVMNIMLVSVTERTKEIGLLKAIGAKRKDILRQFLIESAVLTTIGGVVGICLGVGGTFLVTLIAKIPFIVSLPWVMIAVLISSFVGFIFGLYPARKAASLHPIDALRFE